MSVFPTLPNSLLHITGVEYAITSLIAIFGTLIIALSDNYFTAKARGGVTWREYYLTNNNNCTFEGDPYIWDSLYHKASFVLRRDFSYRMASLIGLQSLFGGGVVNGHVGFSKYIVRIDCYCALLVMYKMHNKEQYEYIQFPCDILFILILLFMCINTYVAYNKYFTIVSVQNDELTVVNKKLFRKTESKEVAIHDIKIIKIYPNNIALPFKLFHVVLELSDGRNISIGNTSSLVKSLSSILVVNNNIKLFMSSFRMPLLYNEDCYTLRTLFPNEGLLCSPFSSEKNGRN